MNAVLIQPREEFGPPERVTELHQCWAYNDAVFSHVIAQAGTPTHTRTPMKTLLAIIIALFAAYCATDDIADIGSERVINHRKQWILRAFGAIVLVVLWCGYMEPHWTRVLFTTIASAPLFSLVFRTALNLLRGKSWWYVSPSNYYDYVFMVMTGAADWKPKGWTWKNYMAMLRHSHWNMMELNENYVKEVKSAGILATVTECTVFVVFSLLGYFPPIEIQ